jgi:hypothetical protein
LRGFGQLSVAGARLILTDRHIRFNLIGYGLRIINLHILRAGFA